MNCSRSAKILVHVSNRQKDLKISPIAVRALVRCVLDNEKTACQEISVYFVTERRICELHREFFNDPTPTDCITFPIDKETLGEIFVCPKTAIRYTGRDSKIGNRQGGCLNLCQAKPVPRELNLYKLGDRGRHKGNAKPTLPKPIFERTACRNPTPSGVGLGKLFDGAVSGDSRTASLSGERISSFQGGVLQSRAVYTEPTQADPYEEVALYIIHGILHLLGYGDLMPDQRRIMRKKEKKCMSYSKEFIAELEPDDLRFST
ncbi:MAG: putative rRNA maturation factor [Parachlamydiales bacterium]|nr:putative rRNA maturation factor [Parachlamydiales bacterium]